MEDPVTQALQPGTPFGSYLILGEIGCGGMATVYHASHQRSVLGRSQSVSALPATEDVDSRRFQSEMRIAASLRHPHIVSAYEVGELNGHLFRRCS